MYYVYVIQSEKTKQIYFGITDNLERRLGEHNNNKQTATANKGPWHLIYYEAYRSKEDATKREITLKHYGNARTYIKNRLNKSFL